MHDAPLRSVLILVLARHEAEHVKRAIHASRHGRRERRDHGRRQLRPAVRKVSVRHDAQHDAQLRTQQRRRLRDRLQQAGTQHSLVGVGDATVGRRHGRRAGGRARRRDKRLDVILVRLVGRPLAHAQVLQLDGCRLAQRQIQLRRNQALQQRHRVPRSILVLRARGRGCVRRTTPVRQAAVRARNMRSTRACRTREAAGAAPLTERAEQIDGAAPRAVRPAAKPAATLTPPRAAL